MALTDFNRACGSLVGGVASLRLIGADALSAVEFDLETLRCKSLQLREGRSFVAVEFVEGSASYTQKTEYAAVHPEVTHRIVFSIPLREDTAAFVERLADTSARCGIVAAVKMSTGVELLAGYSPLLGGEQPLRLAGVAVSTNAGRKDRPLAVVTLESRDAQLSAAM